MKTKGSPKTGGRGKGTPNKITTDLRTWVNEVLNDNREQFTNDLKRLEPHQRVTMFEKLLSYSLPKIQSIQQEQPGKEVNIPIDKWIIQYSETPLSEKDIEDIKRIERGGID